MIRARRGVEMLNWNVETCLPEAVIVEDMVNDACDRREREAKLKLGSRRIDDFAKPLYWVPYIHFG